MTCADYKLDCSLSAREARLGRCPRLMLPYCERNEDTLTASATKTRSLRAQRGHAVEVYEVLWEESRRGRVSILGEAERDVMARQD